jgi:hypothetical protein
VTAGSEAEDADRVSAAEPDGRDSPEDIFIIQYTSGRTTKEQQNGESISIGMQQSE